MLAQKLFRTFYQCGYNNLIVSTLMKSESSEKLLYYYVFIYKYVCMYMCVYIHTYNVKQVCSFD